MKIIEVQNRTPDLISQLMAVWEASVKATHLFLSNEEIENIKNYVPQALSSIAHLFAVKNAEGQYIAFMGIEDDRLEMLFIAPDNLGKGLGRHLLQYGIQNHGVKELTVNEQNPQAKGFYEHLGFRVFRRSPLDEQGNPYPLLYMQLLRK